MKKKGFTLIELVVVMAIIAILALLVVGAITVARRQQIRTANETNAKTIQTGFEAAYGTGTVGQYPVITGTTFNAAATTLGVGIGAGGCANGGGTVSSTTTTYTLTVHDHTCGTSGNRVTTYPQ